jgi:hypothetical protein
MELIFDKNRNSKGLKKDNYVESDFGAAERLTNHTPRMIKSAQTTFNQEKSPM